MTTTTPRDLLTVALQDLRAARCVILARLPAIIDAVSDVGLAAALAAIAKGAQGEQAAFAAMLDRPDGDPNLWASGILDDADRDVGANARGPVRDVALIGAIRKLIAADIVSLETAIALARNHAAQHGEALGGLLATAIEHDHALRARLQALT